MAAREQRARDSRPCRPGLGIPPLDGPAGRTALPGVLPTPEDGQAALPAPPRSRRGCWPPCPRRPHLLEGRGSASLRSAAPLAPSNNSGAAKGTASGRTNGSPAPAPLGQWARRAARMPRPHPFSFRVGEAGGFPVRRPPPGAPGPARPAAVTRGVCRQEPEGGLRTRVYEQVPRVKAKPGRRVRRLRRPRCRG